MRKGILIALGTVATVAAVAVFALSYEPEAQSLYQVVSEEELAFMNFIAKYGRSYGTKAEYHYRLNIFAKNYRRINEHNRSGASYTMAMNVFGDWTDYEFKKLKAFQPTHGHNNHYYAPVADYELPNKVDWRNDGAVTRVKNQGQCGSCWAFSTTGALEGAYFLKHGDLKSFSEQQLVDCSTDNNGCGGGNMNLAFMYLQDTADELESDYPYEAVDGNCRYDASRGVANVDQINYVTPYDVHALKAEIAKGPVSVSIEADQAAFQFYSGGVLRSGCGDALDHGVLAVGYGSDYFLVKNSWGPGWGVDGYIKIGTNTDESYAGVCGILSGPSRPTAV